LSSATMAVNGKTSLFFSIWLAALIINMSNAWPFSLYPLMCPLARSMGALKRDG
jgi:hypothetical protein